MNAPWQRLIESDYPSVMAVLNVTPDSFSDGGQFNNVASALKQTERFLAEGADVIDVGGESTRPGALPVSEREELDRVVPIVEAISREFGCFISLDTSSPVVMKEGIGAGASMINDVRALTREGAMETAASLDVPVCLMHMQGTPETMQQNPQYSDVVGVVASYLAERKAACIKQGVKSEHIVLDPGFGFGKTLAHNMALLANLEKLHELGSPLLIGVSRKSMFGHLLGREVDERLAGTIAATVVAAQKKCAIMRVHDVPEAVDAIKLVTALREYKYD